VHIIRFVIIALVAVLPSNGQTQGSFTELVAIPAGAFTMGSTEGPADERPSHSVTLAAFSIERMPVTNRQFAEFLNARGLGPDRQQWYDPDDGDARIHRAGGKWMADKGAEQLPVVEPTWYGILPLGGQAPADRGGVGEGGPWRRRPPLSVGQRGARSHARALRRRVA
jgi:formylglycine-generating enzyme required for sulfatase activity